METRFRMLLVPLLAGTLLTGGCAKEQAELWLLKLTAVYQGGTDSETSEDYMNQQREQAGADREPGTGATSDTANAGHSVSDPAAVGTPTGSPSDDG